MAKLPRLNLSLTPRQREFVEAEAKRLGISQSDLMRRIVDEHMERHVPKRRTARRE